MASDYISSLIRKRKYQEVDSDDSSQSEDGEEYTGSSYHASRQKNIVEQVREARKKREAALTLPRAKMPSVMDWVDTENARVSASYVSP